MTNPTDKVFQPTNTTQDRVCASLARSALFPKRIHRDVANVKHFPALLQLDLLRDSVLASDPGASISSVFPRHVVVVRNLADGSTQWNGQPDFFRTPSSVSFPVIPNKVSVRCTSNCNEYLSNRSQLSFRHGQDLVLCSDRILKSDAKEMENRDIVRQLPEKSLQAVEEVLARELVLLRHEYKQSSGSRADKEAALAAECYFSRHEYDGKTKIRRGSHLQPGYSLLPSFLQNWCLNRCLSRGMEHRSSRGAKS